MKDNVFQEGEVMNRPKEHYIAMAGLHGCLPQCCEVFVNRNDAADYLAQVHELGKNRTRALKRDGYLELNLKRDGNEYCEIRACICNNLNRHSESNYPATMGGEID